MVLGSATALWDGLRQGKIRSLFMLNADPTLQLDEEQRKLLGGLETLVVWDVAVSGLVELADLALPLALSSEQDGTFVNVQGRLQRLQRALAAPEGVKPGWSSMAALAERLGEPLAIYSAADLFNDLAGRIPAFAGLSYFKLADDGIQLS